MVAGLQILSRGFLGSIKGPNTGEKNKGRHNILRVSLGFQK